MLTIRNKRELRENAALIPLVEQVALCASSGGAILEISEERRSAGASERWVIFQNAQSKGFGITMGISAPNVTPLQRRLGLVTQAQRLASCFVGEEALPLFWMNSEHYPGDPCPESWRVFRIQGRIGTFLCAASFPPPAVIFQGIQLSRSAPKVTLQLMAHVEIDGPLEVGKQITEPRLSVEFVGQRVQGEFVLTEGGIMKIEQVTSAECASDMDTRVILRIELGEIELSLEELMTLRAGGVIELESSTPTRCFMRIGTTTLAEGELSVGDDGISIKVTDVLT